MPIPFVNFLQAPQPRNYLAEMLANLPEQMQQYKQMQLANQKNQALLPYAGPEAQANLQKALLVNQYLPQAQEADIAQKNAAAQKAQYVAMLIKNIMTNGEMGTTTLSSQSSPTPLSNALKDNDTPIANPSNAQTVANPNLNSASATGAMSNAGYPKAALASAILGLGQPKIVDVNGEQVAITPFGQYTVAKGPNAYEKGFQKEMGTFNAKSYADNVNAYNALQNQQVALDELIDATKSPEFRNVTGPVSSWLTKWSGDPRQRELLGQISSGSGEITLQVAPLLKGAFTGKDNTLINSIKANKNDFPDIFIGKLKAQKLISTVLMKRAELAAQYKQDGMKPLEAERKAASEIPLDKYRDQVNKMIYGDFTLPKFNSSKEFQSWYKNQDANTKAKVKSLLGGR